MRTENITVLLESRQDVIIWLYLMHKKSISKIMTRVCSITDDQYGKGKVWEFYMRQQN